MTKPKQASTQIGDYREIVMNALDKDLYLNHKWLNEIYADKFIKYYPESLSVNGDFDLKGFDQQYIGVIIEGDLIVDGNIIDAGYGAFYLYVKGHTEANNLIAGDASIHLNSAYIKDIVTAVYNDGSLRIDDLKCRALFSRSHSTSINKTNKDMISITENGAYDGEINIDNSELAEYWFKNNIFMEIFEDMDWDIEEDDLFFNYYISCSSIITPTLANKATEMLGYLNQYRKAISSELDEHDETLDLFNSVEVDISDLKTGKIIFTEWRKMPIWILRRSNKDLKELQSHSHIKKLLDANSKDTDQQPKHSQNSQRSIHSEILVVIGLCTHLGCDLVHHKKLTSKIDRDNVFSCPCHDSKFDLAGRAYKKGPADSNLMVPPHCYIDDSTILIGSNNLPV